METVNSLHINRLNGLFESALLEEISKVGVYRKISEGDVLIRPGSYIQSVPILLSGIVKISRPGTDGREALLYYLSGTDSCAMSLSCCLASRQSEITAVAEENTEMIAIPVEVIDGWMVKYPTWKQFVFATYQKRFNDLLNTLDSVVFRRLDERLMEYLRRKAQHCNCRILYIKHEEIALELVTSREVISRLLKQLEKLNVLRLSRNKIELLDSALVS